MTTWVTQGSTRGARNFEERIALDIFEARVWRTFAGWSYSTHQRGRCIISESRAPRATQREARLAALKSIETRIGQMASAVFDAISAEDEPRPAHPATSGATERERLAERFAGRSATAPPPEADLPAESDSYEERATSGATGAGEEG